MKKILYVNGCSHSRGMEILGKGIDSLENLNLSFGGQLSNRWNLIHVNDAVLGQGNEAILSQTYDSILKLLDRYSSNDIFVIIGWAGEDRISFIYENEWNRFCSGNETIRNSLAKDAYKSWGMTVDPEVNLNKFSWIYFSMINFLEIKKIKYCMVNGSMFYTGKIPKVNLIHSDNEVTMKIFEHMNKNPKWFNLWKPYHAYLNDAGFTPAPGAGHHGRDANIYFAKELNKFIEENNLK
jgi:hypothetical protein